MVDERPKVVDASAVAALLFGEPEAEAVADRLGEAPLVAPTLLSYELANVCWKKRLRHPESAAALLAGLQRLPRMNVRLVSVDPGALVSTAEAEQLTAYDAAYLWLARYLEAELVTLDSALDAAVRRR